MSGGEKPNRSGPDILHAPWRDTYMQQLSAGQSANEQGVERATFLAAYWANPAQDEVNHVIARVGEGDEAGMILLNRYPYANGHLLIALGDARGRLLDYTPAQRAAFWRLVDTAAELCERTLEPQGLNVGVNQGEAAGAGVPGHLHAHVVPRWHADVNFMTVVGQVRVIPGALEAMARRYRGVWASMGG
jgi:ATP adenylyltransferase